MFTRFALLAAAAVLALAACYSPGKQAEKLAMHREFANAYFDQGQYAEAEAQANLALEIEPDDTSLRLMKAWISQRRGTPQDVLSAEKQFRELIGDKDYRAMLGLAEALERKGVMYAESADAVQRGERPTTASDRVARASEMRETARANWREAVDFYEQTLARKSGEIQAINGLQRVWALLGDYEQSLTWSKTLLEQSTSEIAFWRTQLERVGITADEEANLRRLLGASSKLLVETHLQASTLLFQLGRPEEALSHVDQVVAVEPDNVQAYGRRALLLHKLGRPKEARDNIQEFLRLSTLSIDHPDMQRALELLGQCERELKAAPAQDAR